MANAARYYGTGRRKKSIARVYLAPGNGTITVNKRSIDEYFGLETLKVIVRQPLAATDTDGKFDILVNVKGGKFEKEQTGFYWKHHFEFRTEILYPFVGS